MKIRLVPVLWRWEGAATAAAPCVFRPSAVNTTNALRRGPAQALLACLLLLLSACGGGAGRDSTGWPNQNGDVTVNYQAGLAAMQTLNGYRQQAGLLPVALNYSLSVGCQLHANYLALNAVDLHVSGLDAHGEQAHMPGYSKAGDEAGRASVIYQGVEATEAIEGWMQTFYHRLGLMDPNLTGIGFGSNGGYQVMDIVHGRSFGAQALPGMSRFPPAGMTAAPFAYKNEIPHPIVGDTELGVPITVEFFGSRGREIAGIRAMLSDSLSGIEVPCYLQVPGQPFLADWDLDQVICLIPRDPLEPGRRYSVYFEGYVDGEAFLTQWSFTTRH